MSRFKSPQTAKIWEIFPTQGVTRRALLTRPPPNQPEAGNKPCCWSLYTTRHVQRPCPAWRRRPQPHGPPRSASHGADPFPSPRIRLSPRLRHESPSVAGPAPRRAPLINAAMYAAGSSCVAQPAAGGRGDPVNSATDPRGFIAALLVIKMERSVLF